MISKRYNEQMGNYLAKLAKSKPKPVTNADRIRAMTDEEFATWLSRHLVVMTEYEEHPKRTKRWLDWLKQEVEE